jgi:crotonobetainyl-CoA:carnitine CoA-transferase CaiB-like acyl-CoA transferase
VSRTSPTPERPLAGYRVLDLSRHMAGPYASVILGDFGADVIKVESAPKGDPSRRGGVHFLKDVSALYLTWNRNKRSVCLNLRDEAAIALVKELAKDADVFLENYRPGVVEAMGLGWEELERINPRLVYCSISAFGRRGPWSQRPGTDPCAQALSGVMSVTGERGGRPLLVGIPVADYSSALLAVQGILLGLLARGATGRGQRVDVSLLGSLLFGLTTRVAAYFSNGEDPQQWGSEHSQVAPYQAFRTADGYVVAGVWVEEDWPRFCHAIGLPNLARDPRFCTNSQRVADRDLLSAILNEQFALRTTDEWDARFNELKLLFAPVNTFSEVLESAQVEAMGYVQEHRHPVYGALRQIAPVIQLSETPGGIDRPAPLLGEHTYEVLREAGVSEDELARLSAAGIIQGASSQVATGNGPGAPRESKESSVP